MAKKSGGNLPQTSSVEVSTVNKGMLKDPNVGFIPPGSWSHARNVTHNHEDGDLGVLSNEPSNVLCTSAPYTIIGIIHLQEDEWAVFSTDNINSEIGRFKEGTCNYTKVVNDPCLNFKTTDLIKGVAKENGDCTWQVYWDDGINPSRTINLDEVPWKKIATTVDGCTTYVNTTQLDCDEIRIAKLVNAPCVSLHAALDGGQLANGTYQAFIAYTVDQQRVTDFIGYSNTQSLFTHDNLESSLYVDFTDLDTRFDEFVLVIVKFANGQTIARQFGYYSTRTNRITIDYLDESLVVISRDELLVANPAFEKSEAMFAANGYLFRNAPSTKFDFNYQPLANQIRAKWASVEFSTDYYKKAGNVVGYLRDEQYSFFIRWIYNTGDKSASYHIPGRAAISSELQLASGEDALPVSTGTPRRWQAYNTATLTPTTGSILPNGGTLIQEGLMGYWESTEIYPDDRPDIWGDLCGKKIRHHKFPEECTHESVRLLSEDKKKIRVLGVSFDNIKPPVDNDGNLIPGVVGYEILRGSREGNKSILAKGIINNMGEYTIPGSEDKKSLYPNYPYNDLRTDPFLSETETEGACKLSKQNYTPMGTFKNNFFTFHSPDTSFKHPFLSPTELKVYSEYIGSSTGRFKPVDKHPEHKLLRDTAFLVSALLGLGYALTQMRGKKTITKNAPRTNNIGLGGTFVAGSGAVAAPVTASGTAASADAAATVVIGEVAKTGARELLKALVNFLKDEALLYADLLSGGTTGAAIEKASDVANAAAGATPGSLGFSEDVTWERTDQQNLPVTMRVINGAALYGFHTANGANRTFQIIKNLLPYRQYGYQYVSHGYYNEAVCPALTSKRKLIDDSVYLDSQIQEFSLTRVNNLFRGSNVAIKLTSDLGRTSGVDTSRYTIGDKQAWKNPTKEFTGSSIASHYVGLKFNFENQYGQLDNIMQIPISTCFEDVEITATNQKFKTAVLFNGDTYIGRYTEKNTFFYFYDWLYTQPNGTERDYRRYYNVGYPRFWVNTEEYDFSQFFAGLTSLNFSNAFPSDLNALDGDPSKCGVRGLSLMAKNKYFYLFNSGVRDFWVESEINLAYRDHDDTAASRHYDVDNYTDLDTLFSSDIIKSVNHYKYDYSLSNTKYFGSLISWSFLQTRDYDPTVSEECFTKYPNRLMYSLPSTRTKKDAWRVFLPLNYYDFDDKITAVKEVNQTGSLILFNSSSPMQFRGLDTLQTDSGTKITIGDGGLFANPPQRLINSDKSFEYGSCQDRLSVISTPGGVFWASQNQGKIFNLSNGLVDITRAGMKWWFAKYMPYQITRQFPGYEVLDNPVDGVGMQTIYDNIDEVVYFSKKDFVVKPELLENVTYLSGNDFLVNGLLRVKGGDPQYFDSASWTVSYDIKTKEFVSFHDWHQSLSIPGKNHFLTTNGKDIWSHNETCTSYCNFYGIDYPFEIELITATGQTVNTVRNFQYSVEAYNYKNDCRDRYHVLDENFDEAVVYNSEQVSGLLKLNITPKNDSSAIVTYPKVNAGSIDILFSKEENIYRFNQFYDITNDRGEFSNARRPIWITAPNGYISTLNPVNLDYAKDPHQHKKFRHYINRVLLRKTVSGNNKFTLRLSNTKLNLSLR
jgi:hypothetical protein